MAYGYDIGVVQVFEAYDYFLWKLVVLRRKKKPTTKENGLPILRTISLSVSCQLNRVSYSSVFLSLFFSYSVLSSKIILSTFSSPCPPPPPPLLCDITRLSLFIRFFKTNSLLLSVTVYVLLLGWISSFFFSARSLPHMIHTHTHTTLR